MSTSTRVIVIGIDPAAEAGLVALSVDRHHMADDTRWRWVDCVVVKKSTRTHATKAENELVLFRQAVPWMQQHEPAHIAIERPSDVGKWASGQGQKGQGTGTAFGMGSAYGLMLAACAYVHCRVFDYPVTSRKENPAKNKKARAGWMPQMRGGAHGQLTHVQRRDLLLNDLHAAATQLRQRPHDGILRPDRGERLNENVLMALGVLRFHLSRQVR